MKRKINPNRMELFRLRKRLALAQRGHELLKNKLEGLIQQMTELLARYKVLRGQLDAQFVAVLDRFTVATAVSPQGAVAEAVAQNASPGALTIETRRFMGVSVPVFKPPPQPAAYRYAFTQTPPELDVAFEELLKLPHILFPLAELEKALHLLAHELERTRRRANALEYILIPELQGQRREIDQKIGEQERSNTSRLMKVKDMLMASR